VPDFRWHIEEVGLHVSDPAEIEGKATDRLTFFSDAVVAIAITLLALELPVPSGGTNAEVLHDVNEHVGEYLAFLISFLVISVHWFGHHRVFRYVSAVSRGALQWNMRWLLMIVLTPFAARVISEPGAFEFRFILYAVVQALAALFFMLTLRAVVKSGALVEQTPPDLVPNSFARLAAVAAMFLISIPIAFVTHWAYVCWVAIPFVGVLLIRLRRRGSRMRAA
jgi:TMEM175 potassium channel family protein